MLSIVFLRKRDTQCFNEGFILVYLTPLHIATALSSEFSRIKGSHHKTKWERNSWDMALSNVAFPKGLWHKKRVAVFTICDEMLPI